MFTPDGETSSAIVPEDLFKLATKKGKIYVNIVGAKNLPDFKGILTTTDSFIELQLNQGDQKVITTEIRKNNLNPLYMKEDTF